MKLKIGRIKYADPKFKLTTIGKVRVGGYFYLPTFQTGYPLRPGPLMVRVKGTERQIVHEGKKYVICKAKQIGKGQDGKPPTDIVSHWESTYPVFIGKVYKLVDLAKTFGRPIPLV